MAGQESLASNHSTGNLVQRRESFVLAPRHEAGRQNWVHLARNNRKVCASPAENQHGSRIRDGTRMAFSGTGSDRNNPRSRP